MTSEVKSAVKNCKQCLHHDGDSVRAPLVPIEATGPMDLLHLDHQNRGQWRPQERTKEETQGSKCPHGH